MTGDKKYRVGTVAMVVLAALAGIADLASLIPFVGDFTGPIFWIGTSIYLWKVGCGFVNFRRLATSIISMVAEMIPAIQALPLTTVGIAAVLVMLRIEDKTGLKAPGLGGKQAGSRPLNQNEVRLPDKTPQEGSSEPLNENQVRMASRV